MPLLSLAGTIAVLCLALACQGTPDVCSPVSSACPPTAPGPEDPPLAADSFPVPLIQAGGLYGEGENDPPDAHRAAGILAAGSVPANGAVLASVGMSNTLLEFEAFVQLVSGSTDAILAPTACIGCVVSAWTNTSGPGWRKANEWLTEHGYAPEDVDAVWLKVTRQKEEAVTADDLERILAALKIVWPNTRQVFVSDRIYAGYQGVNVEPTGGWNAGPAVREFVLRHLGETEPWIGWGPYLWANGMEPRSDGMAWLPSDYAPDMVHPNAAGTAKVAGLLSDYFTTRPEAAWFER